MDRIGPLTTGRAAGCCHVSKATTVTWNKRGTLKAYVAPGVHYRILLADFLSLLTECGTPVHRALAPAPQPRLLVPADALVATRARRAPGNNGCHEALWARSQP
jgi:hypothetical protein